MGCREMRIVKCPFIIFFLQENRSVKFEKFSYKSVYMKVLNLELIMLYFGLYNLVIFENDLLTY